jgi:HEAT repeat protein
MTGLRFLASATGLACLTLAASLVGCRSVACPQAESVGQVRECLCGEEDSAAWQEARAVPAEVRERLEPHMELLLSEDSSFQKRAAAGKTLVAAGPEALPLLLCAGESRREVHGSTDDPVNRVILVILAGEDAAGLRARMLSDERNPLRRLYAVRSIGARRSLQEVEFLVEALGDPDYYVREEALEALHLLSGESRIRKPRNVLYQTPGLRQAKEIWVWRIRWRRHGQALFEPPPEPG